jgi:hypothetical protein
MLRAMAQHHEVRRAAQEGSSCFSVQGRLERHGGRRSIAFLPFLQQIRLRLLGPDDCRGRGSGSSQGRPTLRPHLQTPRRSDADCRLSGGAAGEATEKPCRACGRWLGLGDGERVRRAGPTRVTLCKELEQSACALLGRASTPEPHVMGMVVLDSEVRSREPR